MSAQDDIDTGASNQPRSVVETDQQRAAVVGPRPPRHGEAECTDAIPARDSYQRYDTEVVDVPSMRPPVLPPSRANTLSKQQPRGDLSQSSASSHLPGLRQFTRLAPANMQGKDRSGLLSDRPSGLLLSDHTPNSQHAHRSAPQRDDNGRQSAASNRLSDTNSSAPSPGSTENERVRMHDQRTAPSAPPPLLSDLPRHSTDNK